MHSLNDLVHDISMRSADIDRLLQAKEEATPLLTESAWRFVAHGDGFSRRDPTAANFCIAVDDTPLAEARRVSPPFGELLLLALHSLRPQLIAKMLELADTGIAEARATIDVQARAISAEVQDTRRRGR